MNFEAVEEYIEIPSKPGYPIAVQFMKAHPASIETWLIVFINGLRLPANSWNETIKHFVLLNNLTAVNLLSYDRFGQGRTTAKDPLDSDLSREPGYGHDIVDCAQDLHELLDIIAKNKLGNQSMRIVLVAASVGVHIARLYAHSHRSLVQGILILDSNIGHMEYSDFWPDPNEAGFDPNEVIEDDCTLEQYVKATETLAAIFNSNVTNSEGLDRRNIKYLLPSACEPSLVQGDSSPWLSVLVHDPITFAEESFSKLGVPRSLTMKFVNPWLAIGYGTTSSSST